MAIAKVILGLVLFVVGIGAGVMAYGRTQATMDYGPYPPLPEAAEPRAADALTDMLLAGDDRALADRYGEDIVAGLAEALSIGPNPQAASPIVELSDIQYLGTVADGRQTIAMYAAFGTTGDGVSVVTGFSLRVADGEIVGVN